jgi:hypothetical protein
MDSVMRVLKAHIRGGRVVVDEPAELPEGEEVQVLLGGDEMDDAERAALDAALDESEAEAARGELMSLEQFWAEFRANRG